MKLQFFLILCLFPLFTEASGDYATWFQNKSLRFDFLLGGNVHEVTVYPLQMKGEPYWAGSRTNLIDSFGYGSYRYRLFDKESDRLIYSKGFSTLFQEWQTTPEAKRVEKTFYQAAIFPYPRKTVRIEIDARQRDGRFVTLFKTEIDPGNYFILHEPPAPFQTEDILNNGPPEKKVDIVILAEGYTSAEMDKFLSDAERVTNYLFDEEPFQSEKDHFNVRAVMTPSAESGTDIPGEHIYRNTFFNSSFYTFDVPRYLTSSDMKTIYDAAAVVPYDQIYLLVNTARYGGGGFYNFLNVCSSDNQLTREVFVHEFGHGFAGLGDEYYTSDVAYVDFYNTGIEPWEPNLTTLIDFEKKWKFMVPDSIPVPTPRKTKYNKSVGVFEGGGYLAKGIYSPFMDCRMKSNYAEGFCPVCIEAIKKMIQFHCQ